MTKAPASSKPAIALTRAEDFKRLRRLALGAQGLLQNKPFGQGLNGARRAIEHLGYIQIDTISVVQRAHHHVWHSRVPNYHPDMLTKLLAKRQIFEYWSHAAAFLPIKDFRFSLPYKKAITSGQQHWFKSRDKKLMQALLDRIRLEGPLRSRDVDQARGTGAGWWDWKPAKRALEQLYMQGDLMVAARDGFQKTYDLPERVLPAGIELGLPENGEFAAHLIAQQLRCHGFASLKGITYLRRNPSLRETVKQQVNNAVQAGELEQLKLPSGEIYFAPAGTWESAGPRTAHRLVILSPFDNAVIQRPRLQSLFNFDYQIECYVPAAKRRYGYFCLPLLYRDQFVGRLDAKAHRKQNTLELVAVHFCDHPFAEDAIMDAFAKALDNFMTFQGCATWRLTSVSPATLKAPLVSHLEQIINRRTDNGL